MRACKSLRARQCDCCPAGFSVEAHATAWQVAARPQLAVPWTRCEPAEASLPHLALLTALAPSFAVQRDDYNEALRLLRARPLDRGHGIAFDIFARRRSSTSRSCRRSCASDVTFFNLLPRNGRTRHHEAGAATGRAAVVTHRTSARARAGWQTLAAAWAAADSAARCALVMQMLDEVSRAL